MKILILNKFICMVLIFFLCATMLHEVGHIFMGIVLHFKLQYVEVFGIRIELSGKRKKILVNPKINAKTCMYPIGKKYLFIRLILYYLGGIICNCLFVVIVWKVIKCNEIKWAIEAALGISMILAILPFRGTDLDNILILLDKEKRIHILMKFYLMNNISPCNMPTEWFTWISQNKCSMKNIYIQKMWYYRLLEEGTNVQMIKKVFGELRPLLMQTKYLKDKCEVLFYYALIQEDREKAIELQQNLEKMILKSNLSSKKRMLLTMEYLNGGGSKIYEYDSCNTEISGISTLEDKIISNFLG